MRYPSVSDLPALPKSSAPAGHPQATPQSKIVPVYLNQNGFNLGKPKRFTAPTIADGTRFIVRTVKGGAALAQGVLKDHKGDFSSFNPAGDAEYAVEVDGLVSVPFRIGPFWLERITYQGAVDLMIDSRHDVGNARSDGLLVYPPVPELAASEHSKVRVRAATDGGEWRNAFVCEGVCKTIGKETDATFDNLTLGGKCLLSGDYFKTNEFVSELFFSQSAGSKP